MRYFIDTEYDFDAANHRVTPFSIGIVAEDGREYYAVTTCWTDPDNEFFAEYVESISGVPVTARRSPFEISGDLLHFICDDTPEFWGDYAAFDYVVLSIIMGGFDAWPKGWPMVIRDLQETPAGQEASGSVASLKPHNALYDARALRDAWAIANEPYRGSLFDPGEPDAS